MTEEPMHPIEIKGHLTRIGLTVQILMDVPTDDLLRAFSFNSAMGPLLDPTTWIATRDNAKANEAIVRAVAEFQKAIRAAIPDYDAQAEAAREARP